MQYPTQPSLYVLDRTPPVIKWNANRILFAVYQWGELNFDPLDSVEVMDNYDKNCVVVATGSYYTDFLKRHYEGLYNIQLNAKDSSGNMAHSVGIYIITTIGIREFEEVEIRVIPNPNQGKFTLMLENPEIVEKIRILDLTGREILTA